MTEKYVSAMEHWSGRVDSTFDAHFDLRPYDKGSSSGSMFRQNDDIYWKKGMKYRMVRIFLLLKKSTRSFTITKVLM